MKLFCVAIGKKHDSNIVKAIDDYSARLQRYTMFKWQLLPSAKGKMDVEEIRRAESAAITAHIKDDDYVVLMDEGGIELTSSELADILDVYTAKRIVFVIGGAYGVTDRVKRRADVLWALSKLTFPHQLVRLIFAEQLYRANTIRCGEPYHHK